MDLNEYKKISALKIKIFHDLIQSGKKSFNEISQEQKECFEEEYDKFGIALLHLKLEYHSCGEKSGMNIQPLFEEFRDNLKY